MLTRVVGATEDFDQRIEVDFDPYFVIGVGFNPVIFKECRLYASSVIPIHVKHVYVNRMVLSTGIQNLQL